MPNDIATFELPSVTRTEDSAALHSFLLENTERPVFLAADKVEKLAGSVAQTIVAHSSARQGTPWPLAISDPSDQLRDALAMLGLADVLEDGE